MEAEQRIHAVPLHVVAVTRSFHLVVDQSFDSAHFSQTIQVHLESNEEVSSMSLVVSAQAQDVSMITNNV